MTLTTPSLQTKTTPMMAQWNECKKLAKSALLLFRMGDFYEAFYEDAEVLARELELTLTKRQGIPMSGVPHHTCQTYIDKLIAKGIRVAVAEQTEDPKQAKGLVRREVTRVVTPGTLIDSALLPEKGNNFFLCIDQSGKGFGLASIDVSTATFRIIEVFSEKELLNEIHRIRPKELLCSTKFYQRYHPLCTELQKDLEAPFHQAEEWRFEYQEAYYTLINHFHVQTLDGFGLKGFQGGVNAAGALLTYLKEELLLSVDHIKSLNTYSTGEYMSLDYTSLRNLELTESLRDGSKKNTLSEVLDHTQTAMGGRLLTFWIRHPLLDIEKITARQKGIAEFLTSPIEMEEIRAALKNIRDLERLTMRIMAGCASPKDLACLRDSLHHLPEIKQRLNAYSSSILKHNTEQLVDIAALQDLLNRSLVQDPPLRISDGKIFREGYHPELDELRSVCQNSKEWIARYQQTLKEQFGIKSLKVNYTKAFGYYIEVSKGQAYLMPDTFQRRQTLVNNERFISPELKEYESKVLTADERISSLETQLFQQLKQEVATYSEPLQQISQALAVIDCLLSLSHVARRFNYVCPTVDTSDKLHIESGRHPVIEAVCLTEPFVPNDTQMNGSDQRLILLTGPNMAGKSTYIRQVALLVIMAQLGSFVPAKRAHIGLVDKVFTRVGASDDLSRGHSTFMVEMSETANILNHVTSNSLVILDEIGRGTSTYDGISIAWAVAEYLLTTEGKQAKTLFATHYWELTKLEEQIPGAMNFNVAVQETDETIVFLRKIVRGDTDKSYGIHVARLAGLPCKAIARAQEILVHLEENANRENVFESEKKKTLPATKVKKSDSEIQFLLFEPPKKKDKKPDKVLSHLKGLSINDLTPMQAHSQLARLLELASDL